MSELNALTKRLYAQGFTRENHPAGVYWNDYQNLGYKLEVLLGFTWETPCGLLIQGESDSGRSLAFGDTSYGGVWYCPENDNPLLRCPFDRKSCTHVPKGFPVTECPCHRTSKPYCYDESVEKVTKERDREWRRQYMEITGGSYCACVVDSNGYEGGLVEVKYDVDRCIQCGCKNTVCVLRKQERDLRRSNVFYDVRRTWVTRIGFLEETKTEITKGLKVFKRPVARTDAELWLQIKQADFNPLHDKSVIHNPKMTREDRQQQFFSKMHRRYGEYDYFEFRYEVENIRIASHEQRDLLQDLRDVAEGIEVVHAVDLDRAKAAEKREARRRRRELKTRISEKKRRAGTPAMEQLSLFAERTGEKSTEAH